MKRLLKAAGVLILLGFIGFFSFAPSYVDAERNPVRPREPYPISDAAQTVQDSLIIGDWHADSLLWKRDLLKQNTAGHVDITQALLNANVPEPQIGKVMGENMLRVLRNRLPH